MAEAIYRLPCTDERYGRLCPYCAGPKTVQASECWSCFVDRLRGEDYWAARTCPDCLGPRTPGRQRCRRCTNARCVPSGVGRPQPQDHPLAKGPSMSERYVNARELAELMGVSSSTIKRWVAEGMPSETWGMRRTRRFLPSRVMTWARNRHRMHEARNGDDSASGTRQPKE